MNILPTSSCRVLVPTTALVCCFALRAATPPPAAAPDTLPADVAIERVELARVAAGVARSGDLRISRDFNLLAYREGAEGGKRVVVGGVPGYVYSNIFSLEFAPAGHRYGYEAKIGDGQNAIVIDGERGPVFATADNLVWSGDGKHFAYRAQRPDDGAWAVVRDGVVGTFQPGKISKLALSFDGLHLATVREDNAGRERLASYDGQPLAPNATGFSFSPFKWSTDSATFAFIAEQVKDGVNERFLVVNGEERGRGSNIDPDYLVLSAAGRHFAANISVPGGKETVVHDGRTYGPYENLWGKPTLSANGQHVAFVATLADGFAHVLIDGQPGPAASTRFGVKRVLMSPTGRTVAWLQQTGENTWAAHLGDHTLPPVGDIRDLWLSPDASRIAWVSKVAAGMQVVVDGRAIEPVFNDVAPEGPQFTPDNHDFVYVATRDRQSFTVCVFGVGSRTYEIAAPLLQFPAPNAFTFVSYEKGVFYRETWTLPRVAGD
jgi:hypothetical protein